MAAAVRRPATALNDMELAELAGVGDRSALGELARRYGPGVRALLRRAGAEPRFADAVARRAFLTAFESMVEFRGQGAFASWIRRLAARQYLAGRSTPDDPGGVDAPFPSASGGDAGAAPNADIDGVLGELPAHERLCVCVCCGAGLTAVEVAAATATPVEAVRSSLHRGLHRMRNGFDPGADEAASGVEFERRLQRALVEVTSSGDDWIFARDVERRLGRSGRRAALRSRLREPSAP